MPHRARRDLVLALLALARREPLRGLAPLHPPLVRPAAPRGDVIRAVTLAVIPPVRAVPEDPPPTRRAAAARPGAGEDELGPVRGPRRSPRAARRERREGSIGVIRGRRARFGFGFFGEPPQISRAFAFALVVFAEVVKRVERVAELRDPLDAFYDFGEDDQGERERAADLGGFAEESETESGASSSNNPNRTLATLATRGAGRATRTANGSELILPGAGSSGGGASGRRRVLGHRAYRRYYRQSYRADYVAAGGSRSDERRVERRQPAQRLATRESQKRQNQIATRAMRHAKAGASKALAAQFSHKAGFADNAARRAIVHHWGAGGGGSHYHTAGSKQFLKGVRIRGVVSRHSKQGAKMQAARVQAARNKQNRGNASVAVLRSSTRKG